MITDEEIKLKRLQTTEVGRCRASIKNRRRDYKILEAQKDLTIGRLVNNKLVSWTMASNCMFYYTYYMVLTENIFIKN